MARAAPADEAASNSTNGRRRSLRPLIETAQPVADLFGTYPYVEFQRLIDDPPGFRNWWTAEYVTELPDEAIDGLCSYGESIPTAYSQLLVVPWGGAVSVPDGTTPLANRDAAYVIHPFMLRREPERDRELADWGRRVREVFAPWATGGTYLNFIGDEAPTGSAPPSAPRTSACAR
jgi:hypothetical protein